MHPTHTAIAWSCAPPRHRRRSRGVVGDSVDRPVFRPAPPRPGEPPPPRVRSPRVQQTPIVWRHLVGQRRFRGTCAHHMAPCRARAPKLLAGDAASASEAALRGEAVLRGAAVGEKMCAPRPCGDPRCGLPASEAAQRAGVGAPLGCFAGHHAATLPSLGVACATSKGRCRGKYATSVFGRGSSWSREISADPSRSRHSSSSKKFPRSRGSASTEKVFEWVESSRGRSHIAARKIPPTDVRAPTRPKSCRGMPRCAATRRRFPRKLHPTHPPAPSPS
jgi:hypothetical protein